MVSALSAILATTRRILDAPQPVFAPAGERCFEPSRAEQMEAHFRVAGQTLGECPSWVLVALEQAEGRGVYDADA
ncbi:hypothetical protein ASD64_13795 [Mesorhizobium sp. Root157]|uniref:hypothetical protein n=1 Tax=Mesorhizobium sp. Root157 TaxID=1736477 RepID=UPI0006F6FE04|nr:hypothetical protein [Mesorhizobium sp. Root157]KQZ99884.1 hypothetical protein ASD64_13795 [Mesorhizobium sp. Root157]